jgi:hypothetical protein
MSVGVPCFLVEWYRSSLDDETLDAAAGRLTESAASMSAAGAPVHLLTMLAVPADEVLFGVFTGGSVRAVAQTCERAGLPAQRVTAATDLRTC